MKIQLLKIIKKIAGTLFLPVLMYLIMLWACRANGVDYFGTWDMWKRIIADLALSLTSALGIGIQFKNGRFDFSGGAVMLLSSILAARIAFENLDNNPWLFFLLCLGICIVLNILIAFLYIRGRMPIVITTISAALIIEAISCNIYKGAGINFVANIDLKAFSTFPLVLLPLALSMAAYAFYSHLTIAGKQSALLANNQLAAVHIGISEAKNIMMTYIFGGIIFGCATSIFATTGIHRGAFDSLSTVGSLFTNILPVFVGLFLGAFCVDTIGIAVGSLTLCLMSFGLKAVFNDEVGSAINIMMIAVFLLLLNITGSRGRNIIKMLTQSFRPNKTERQGTL